MCNITMKIVNFNVDHLERRQAQQSEALILKSAAFDQMCSRGVFVAVGAEVEEGPGIVAYYSTRHEFYFACTPSSFMLAWLLLSVC